MKRISVLAFTLVILASVVTAHHTARAARKVTFQVFYDSLAPYGQWMKDERYGFVWLPSVEADFHPYYSHGHWAMTDQGNTWISAYAWGWAAFHYGRWTYDSFYGWIWIPGQDWGPAWVSWRLGKNCYGWAPLAPGIADSSLNKAGCPGNWWVFAPAVLIHHPHFHPYTYPPGKRRRVLRRSKVISCDPLPGYEDHPCAGPGIAGIEERTGNQVKVWALFQNEHPGMIELTDTAIILFHPKRIVHVQTDTPFHYTVATRPIGGPQPMRKRSLSEIMRDSYGHPVDKFDTPKRKRSVQPDTRPYMQKHYPERKAPQIQVQPRENAIPLQQQKPNQI